MFIGRDISCDEQDIGFQGKHTYKQGVTFKKAGDGLLLDSLRAYSYTYLFHFGNQVASKSWIYKGLSPLHTRLISLL